MGGGQGLDLVVKLSRDTPRQRGWASTYVVGDSPASGDLLPHLCAPPAIRLSAELPDPLRDQSCALTSNRAGAPLQEHERAPSCRNGRNENCEPSGRYAY